MGAGGVNFINNAYNFYQKPEVQIPLQIAKIGYNAYKLVDLYSKNKNDDNNNNFNYNNSKDNYIFNNNDNYTPSYEEQNYNNN